MASTVWRGHLAFGLVSFPVRLYKAARPEKISFRRLYRPSPSPASGHADLESKLAASLPPVESEPEEAKPEPPRRGRGSQAPPAAAPEPEQVQRTRNAVVSDMSDQPVERGDIVRGYEYDKGRYVVLEDEDIRSITPQTSKEMQILEFVRLAEVDPIYFETSYYVAPDEAGERPYSLLQEALRQTGFVGLAQLAMHSREHIVLVRPGKTGMIAHTMYYPDEVRSSQEFRTDTSNINARELDLAKRLIETLAAPFEPEKFRDTFRERLREMIDAKVKGRQVAEERETPRRTAAVVDIMDALQKSLNAARKPAAASPAPARKTRTKKAG
jgi:DNA end-binding protein Ku